MSDPLVYEKSEERNREEKVSLPYVTDKGCLQNFLDHVLSLVNYD